MIDYIGYTGHTITDIEWLMFLASTDIANYLPSIRETIMRTGHPLREVFGLSICYEGMSATIPSDPTRLSPCISIALEKAPEGDPGQCQYTDVGDNTKGPLVVTVCYKNWSNFRFGLENVKGLLIPGFSQLRMLRPEQVGALRTEMGISRVPHYLVLESSIEELEYKQWDFVDEIWAQASMQGGNIWEAIENTVSVVEKGWREVRKKGVVLYRSMAQRTVVGV